MNTQQAYIEGFVKRAEACGVSISRDVACNLIKKQASVWSHVPEIASALGAGALGLGKFVGGSALAGLKHRLFANLGTTLLKNTDMGRALTERYYTDMARAGIEAALHGKDIMPKFRTAFGTVSPSGTGVVEYEVGKGMAQKYLDHLAAQKKIKPSQAAPVVTGPKQAPIPAQDMTQRAGAPRPAGVNPTESLINIEPPVQRIMGADLGISNVADLQKAILADPKLGPIFQTALTSASNNTLQSPLLRNVVGAMDEKRYQPSRIVDWFRKGRGIDDQRGVLAAGLPMQALSGVAADAALAPVFGFPGLHGLSHGAVGAMGATLPDTLIAKSLATGNPGAINAAVRGKAGFAGEGFLDVMRRRADHWGNRIKQTLSGAVLDPSIKEVYNAGADIGRITDTTQALAGQARQQAYTQALENMSKPPKKVFGKNVQSLTQDLNAETKARTQKDLDRQNKKMQAKIDKARRDAIAFAEQKALNPAREMSVSLADMTPNFILNAAKKIRMPQQLAAKLPAKVNDTLSKTRDMLGRTMDYQVPYGKHMFTKPGPVSSAQYYDLSRPLRTSPIKRSPISNPFPIYHEVGTSYYPGSISESGKYISRSAD